MANVLVHFSHRIEEIPLAHSADYDSSRPEIRRGAHAHVYGYLKGALTKFRHLEAFLDPAALRNNSIRLAPNPLVSLLV